jgi:hypothetical protein
MITIQARLEVSENNSYRVFTLEDLNVTETEWNNLSESEKSGLVEKAVFDLPEQPYWCLDSFSEQ